MEIRESLKYTKEHEWLQKQGGSYVLGITDFAQNALGDIVFVELPQVGRSVSKGQSIGVVESIKSVSDLYTPIGGKISEVNDELTSRPEKLNQSPYESWIVKIESTESTDFNALMDGDAYRRFCEQTH